MKSCLLAAALLTAVGLRAAEPTPASPGANVMIIEAEDPVELTTTNVVYRKNVHVLDPHMEMWCQSLTVRISTNRPPAQTNLSASATNTPTARRAAQRIDMIVAETNVIILQKEGRATGDRAVYTATNDVVRLSGNVVVEFDVGFVYCAEIIFDRRTDSARLVPPPGGKVITRGKEGVGLFGTNSFGLSLPGLSPTGRKTAKPPK